MTITVIRGGLLTTVQDLGRPGLQHLAIVPGGAMDAGSHRVANALVGNGDDAATLELALSGPTLRFECDTLVALHGARFDARLDAGPMPLSRPVLVRAGMTLTIGRAVLGAFGYLAAAGGIRVSRVLGARATYLAGGFGGLDGRALAAGAVVPLVETVEAVSHQRFVRLGRSGRTLSLGGVGSGQASGVSAPKAAGSVRWWVSADLGPAGEPVVVRIVDGVHAEAFDAASRDALIGQPWRVSGESNRMGYRLVGPVLTRMSPRELVSQPVGFGTVQVPPAGQPIVLMADRQTTGGYPRIAEVIRADRDRLAQVVPGSASLKFERVDLEQADAARGETNRRLAALIDRLHWEYA